MRKIIHFYSAVLIILMASFISCSDDDTPELDHSLDNTSWASDLSSGDTYVYGLSFYDGFAQKVRIDKKTGLIIEEIFSAEYSMDKSKEQIIIYINPEYKSRSIIYTYKKGIIFDGYYPFYRK